MTELNHSSVMALLHDLARHQDDLFRFRYHSDNNTSPPWRLKSASPTTNASDDDILICVEYTTGNTDDFRARLYGGLLVYSGTLLMTVVVVGGPPPSGGSLSVDDSQSGQLDKNLRGIFA